MIVISLKFVYFTKAVTNLCCTYITY